MISTDERCRTTADDGVLAIMEEIERTETQAATLRTRAAQLKERLEYVRALEAQRNALDERIQAIKEFRSEPDPSFGDTSMSVLALLRLKAMTPKEIATTQQRDKRDVLTDLRKLKASRLAYRGRYGMWVPYRKR